MEVQTMGDLKQGKVYGKRCDEMRSKVWFQVIWRPCKGEIEMYRKEV